MEGDVKTSRLKIDDTANKIDDGDLLVEVHESLKMKSLDEIISTGQLLNLVLFNTTNAEQRCRKKQILVEQLLRFLDRKIEFPLQAQDALIALYDSAEDLQLLAIINLVSENLRLPKSVEQNVVAFIDSGAASDNLKLFASSVAMNRAVVAIPRELTNLLLFSCGVLVKNQQELKLASLLYLRAYLSNSNVLAGTLPSDMLPGRDVVEKFCQKVLKHRPIPMTRECVSFLLAASSPLYADVLRELFARGNQIEDILQAAAMKYPSEMFEVFARTYNISPADGIPLKTISSIVDNLIVSRGCSDVLTTIVRFALSCSETECILKSFFDEEDDEVDSEIVLKSNSLIDLFQTLKMEGSPQAVWPAVALRFLGNNVVEESLADGSLQSIVEEALKMRDERIAAILLLCPILKSYRLPVLPTLQRFESTESECTNCAQMKIKINANEAATQSMAQSVAKMEVAIGTQKSEISKMKLKVVEANGLVHQRNGECSSLQKQIIAKERKIQELKTASEQFETQLEDQRSKNQETMTALKQARRDGEKTRADLDRKRGECQQLQREVASCKEQLVASRKKIEELESFKEKLNSLLGAFPK